MINVADISHEINILENGPITYPILEKLSVLYMIQHHFEKDEEEVQISKYSNLAPSSEFLEAIKGVPIDSALQILNEHMEAVKVVFPKEYNEVLRKIRETV